MKVPPTFWLLVLLTAPYVAGATAGNYQGQDPQTADTVVIDKFEQLVADYVKVRNSKSEMPKRPTSSPEKLTEGQKNSAVKVQQERAPVKEGCIFTPDIGTYFRRQIQKSLAGPQGKEIRVSLKHAEPVRGVKLVVNQRYPQGLPLQSTPPSLLLNLPRLPEELQYRVIGQDLVLLDNVTNLVVDVARNAIPVD